MTHEEIEGAIERLRKISYGARVYNALEVVMAVIPDGSWTDGLTDLLRQADPDTHVELPVDADGEYIHIGDELVSNHSKKKFAVTRIQYSREHAWMVGGGKYGLYASRETRHHKPTVSSVLDELEGLRGTGDYEAVVTRAAELAGQLRDLLEVDG